MADLVMGCIAMLDHATEQMAHSLRKIGLQGVPCDEATVAELEQQLGVEWPAAYRAFLLIAGNGCQALEGSAYTVADNLCALQRIGRRIARPGKFELPQDAFVFRTHQGFVCTFFLLHDGDDPQVHEYFEGSSATVLVAPRFTDWVIAALRAT